MEYHNLHYENYDVIKVLRENAGVQSVLAKHKITGEKKFIKTFFDPSSFIMIQREYYMQNTLYLLSQIHDCGFYFLEPILNGPMLILPALDNDVQWFGSGFFEKANLVLIEDYVNQFFALQKVLHSLDLFQMSKFIVEDFETRRGSLLGKLRVDIDFLSEHDLIVNNVACKAVEFLLDTNNESWRLQHHDAVPWHMAKRKDGSIVLIDSGWGAWSFRYYDIVYTALQLTTYGNCPDDGYVLLKRSLQECKKDKLVQKHIQTVLHYRYCRLLRELYEQKQFTAIERLNNFYNVATMI